MKPEVKGRSVVSSGDKGTAKFGISSDDTAHLMTILRDTLYSDKVLAVLREYGANAWDANRMAGRGDRPIRVQLPTPMEPNLVIEDDGPGLSHDEVFRIFTQYGASTKRDSNDAVGYLGIGSKSGFAYSDSFMITSRHGGMRRVYVAVLDASEEGEIRLLSEEPCDEADTGLAIQIGIRPDDIEEFVEKAKDVFRFYSPRPTINTELPPPVTESTLLPNESGWLAVMGPVAYPIDCDKLEVPKFVSRSGGVVFFDIGDLRVAASREQLKYDDHTKKNLVRRLNDTLDAYVKTFVKTLDGLSPWDRRLRLQGMSLFGQLLGDSAPKAAFESSVALGDYKPKGIRIAFTGIRVNANTRFVFVDDRRSISGFNLTEHRDYLVRRAPEATQAEAWKGLQDLIKALQIDGVTVVKTSELPWERPQRAVRSAKHKVSAFVFQPDNLDSHRSRRGRTVLSDMWEPVEREESEDDVYVVMEAFRTDFYDWWREDRRILSAFGLTPTVYGYKRSSSQPNDHQGTTYAEWRAGLYDMVREQFTNIDEVIAALPYGRYAYHQLKVFDRAIKALGRRHPLAQVIIKIRAAVKLLRDTPEERKEIAKKLANRMGKSEDKLAIPEMKLIQEKYPLISWRLDVFFSLDDWQKWIDYILGMDALAEKRAAQTIDTDADNDDEEDSDAAAA